MTFIKISIVTEIVVSLMVILGSYKPKEAVAAEKLGNEYLIYMEKYRNIKKGMLRS